MTESGNGLTQARAGAGADEQGGLRNGNERVRVAIAQLEAQARQQQHGIDFIVLPLQHARAQAQGQLVPRQLAQAPQLQAQQPLRAQSALQLGSRAP